MTSTNHEFTGLVPDEQRTELNNFPAALRELLFAELTAGNVIVEIGHSFPAAPAGAYVLLANEVSTRARSSTAGISFYERDTSQFFAEYADEKRHFFVLESPRPPEPVLTIDAIRAALPHSPLVIRPETSDPVARADVNMPRSADDVAKPTAELSALERFEESRDLNYDRWREGTGYDLDALKSLTPDDRRRLEPTFIPAKDWRDVEALIALRTKTAKAALIAAAHAADPQLRLAVLSRAPELFDDSLKTETLLLAVDSTAPFAGLSAALDAIEEFHPATVQIAMWAATLNRGGDIAYHMGTSLAVIHKKISSRFDWSLRPMLLKFNTEDTIERGRAFLWLYELLHIEGKQEFAEVTKMVATVKRLRKL